MEAKDLIESGFCKGCSGRQDFDEISLFICEKLGAVAVRDMSRNQDWTIFLGLNAVDFLDGMLSELNTLN